MPWEVIMRSATSPFWRTAALCAAAFAALPLESGAQDTVTFDIARYFELGEVSDPKISPKGDWIAYAVARRDLEKDKSASRIWMVPAKGGQAVAMTAEGESSSTPRWSPDGGHLAFLSARNGKPAQIWILNRNGGEAVQVTDTAQPVRDFAWSPDSSRLLLVLQDPKPEEVAAKEQGENHGKKIPGPWVIDREFFKTDYVGYLDRRRTHIYVQDLAGGEPVQLTFGDYDDTDPAWSPDGARIAFVSNRSATPDLNENTDIWVVSSQPSAAGETPLTRITANPGADDMPAWSPDGKRIAHRSVTRPETMYYSTPHLAVSNAAGGGSRVLTESLDRVIFEPEFSRDGRFIHFLLEDGGEQFLARMSPAGGDVERLVGGRNVVYGYDEGPNGGIALLISQPHLPNEVFMLQDGNLAQRSFTNREVLADVALGEVVEVRFESEAGVTIEGFIVKPPGFEEGRKYPTILNIHGGPQSQYDFSFNTEAQLMAGGGFVSVLPNPRGSTGYGREFCLAIWQDWGGPDYLDVMAAVDDAVERGWADPDRLGVMGWSYGGMLTNHIITRTGRFKAAATGASATLYAANYGHDMYVRWWEQELGFPWEPEARAHYERMSPFNKVQNVTTPTLVLGGEIDWNVPIINSEQLYLALKRLGVETQLVVYPGEYHGIDTPTHRQDLYQRYLDWFAERL
jgi:dipeptidyl aminopeptidase/acylaminoacyl peptidase